MQNSKKKHSTPESPTELSVVELDCEECRHQVMRRRKNVWREKKKKKVSGSVALILNLVL